VPSWHFVGRTRENFTFIIMVVFEAVFQVTTVHFSYCFITDDSMSAGTSDSEEEAMKTLRKKKSFLEKESEMVMKALLASSSGGDASGK
jgi:cell division protein FtsB